jgi:hypothetical protein
MGLYAMERARLMPKNFLLTIGVQMLMFAGELYVAVPLAIAFYPKTGTIKAEELEPEFKEWKD